jgi:hypothetical protein
MDIGQCPPVLWGSCQTGLYYFVSDVVNLIAGGGDKRKVVRAQHISAQSQTNGLTSSPLAISLSLEAHVFRQSYAQHPPFYISMLILIVDALVAENG